MNSVCYLQMSNRRKLWHYSHSKINSIGIAQSNEIMLQWLFKIRKNESFLDYAQLLDSVQCIWSVTSNAKYTSPMIIITLFSII